MIVTERRILFDESIGRFAARSKGSIVRVIVSYRRWETGSTVLTFNRSNLLAQHARLVEVTSNIWGTKFKFHGLADSIPANLGQVTYRTSLLHLQPRQMTLVMTELRDDLPSGELRDNR